MKTLLLITILILSAGYVEAQRTTTELCSPEGITLPKCPEITINWARNFARAPDVNGNERSVDLGFRSDGMVVWRFAGKANHVGRKRGSIIGRLRQRAVKQMLRNTLPQ